MPEVYFTHPASPCRHKWIYDSFTRLARPTAS
jgi:hypothetical protein